MIDGLVVWAIVAASCGLKDICTSLNKLIHRCGCLEGQRGTV